MLAVLRPAFALLCREGPQREVHTIYQYSTEVGWKLELRVGKKADVNQDESLFSNELVAGRLHLRTLKPWGVGENIMWESYRRSWLFCQLGPELKVHLPSTLKYFGAVGDWRNRFYYIMDEYHTIYIVYIYIYKHARPYETWRYLEYVNRVTQSIVHMYWPFSYLIHYALHFTSIQALSVPVALDLQLNWSGEELRWHHDCIGSKMEDLLAVMAYLAICFISFMYSICGFAHSLAALHGMPKRPADEPKLQKAFLMHLIEFQNFAVTCFRKQNQSHYHWSSTSVGKHNLPSTWPGVEQWIAMFLWLSIFLSGVLLGFCRELSNRHWWPMVCSSHVRIVPATFQLHPTNPHTPTKQWFPAKNQVLAKVLIVSISCLGHGHDSPWKKRLWNWSIFDDLRLNQVKGTVYVKPLNNIELISEL